MSFLFAAPEALVTAASDLAGVGSMLNAANEAVAGPTAGVVAAAADQVSAQVAAFLSQHGLDYQRLSAQVSAFHERFVQALTAGAGAYAAAEANAARTLADAVDAPAAATLGNPALGGGAAGAVSGAVNRIESALLGSGFPGAAGVLGGTGARFLDGAAGAVGQAEALLLRPVGGIGAIAAGALLAPAAASTAAVVPAANALVSIGDAIEAAYLAIEPWVQYGFNLAAYAAGWLPWVGWLAPQINFFYYLFEPIVQSVLFNTIDFIDGTVSFTQGLNNIWAATTASVNQFINTEIYWVLSFLPPLPPIGVNVP
ncbi:PE family protein [Mycobacterium palustre]|uniref:PE family protein n=2 Tax=Mycobacterium palustre TaxID=153971 RepID=A0A1X2A0Y7_9MYCO|nr:PE family protein [Mycobacterium palustre]ORW34555.1 PE family protein [Mycobacterium palustre]